MMSDNVLLRSSARDRLWYKLALWEEELRTRISRLVGQVKALNAEYQAIMDL